MTNPDPNKEMLRLKLRVGVLEAENQSLARRFAVLQRKVKEMPDTVEGRIELLNYLRMHYGE